MYRIWEIDFFRGIAIILMIIFHTIFDLSYYYGISINYSSGLWYYEGKLAALTFIFLSGICSNLSRNTIKRGIQIFLWGMLLTILTFFIDKSLYIKFGILHFLGISILFSSLFKNMDEKLLLIIGTFIIIVSNYIDKITVNFPYLFPFGLTDQNFASLDYYPIIPYFGVFLYGIVFYKIFYSNGKKLIKKDLKNNPVTYLGRHSLTIYLIHQPVIIFILSIIKKLLS